MSKDAKIFNGCDHYVKGSHYVASGCPRCCGRGYYYDIAFDELGEAVVCSGTIKLQQEVLKIMNDKKGGNDFAPEWGNLLAGNALGSKNLKNTDQRIQMIIYETLQYLKNIQINNQVIFKNMTNDEIIEEIVELNVTRIGPLGYTIYVKFKNASDEIFTQKIII